MLLRLSTWHLIREQFTEEEKASLNAAITGEVICPRGCRVDDEKLPDGLRSKLLAAVKPHSHAGGSDS
jgi:hypothetical protein